MYDVEKTEISWKYENIDSYLLRNYGLFLKIELLLSLKPNNKVGREKKKQRRFNRIKQFMVFLWKKKNL